jgi:hypothetical protein
VLTVGTGDAGFGTRDMSTALVLSCTDVLGRLNDGEPGVSVPMASLRVVAFPICGDTLLSQ